MLGDIANKKKELISKQKDLKREAAKPNITESKRNDIKNKIERTAEQLANDLYREVHVTGQEDAYIKGYCEENLDTSNLPETKKFLKARAVKQAMN